MVQRVEWADKTLRFASFDRLQALFVMRLRERGREEGTRDPTVGTKVVVWGGGTFLSREATGDCPASTLRSFPGTACSFYTTRASTPNICETLIHIIIHPQLLHKTPAYLKILAISCPLYGRASRVPPAAAEPGFPVMGAVLLAAGPSDASFSSPSTSRMGTLSSAPSSS